MKLEVVEPLRELFKDEVREVGDRARRAARAVAPPPVPRARASRSACVGEVTRERLDDPARGRRDRARTRSARAGWYDALWQAFAVFLPVRSVGVMGDDAHLRERDRAALRDVARRHDRRLGAAAARAAGAHLEPHHQRGPRREPRRVRHLEQAARDDRVGVTPALAERSPADRAPTRTSRRLGMMGGLRPPRGVSHGLGLPAPPARAGRRSRGRSGRRARRCAGNTRKSRHGRFADQVLNGDRGRGGRTRPKVLVERSRLTGTQRRAARRLQDREDRVVPEEEHGGSLRGRHPGQAEGRRLHPEGQQALQGHRRLGDGSSPTMLRPTRGRPTGGLRVGFGCHVAAPKEDFIFTEYTTPMNERE